MGLHCMTFAIMTKADVDALSTAERDAMFSTIPGDYADQRESNDALEIVVKWLTSDGEPDNIPTHTKYTASGIEAEMAKANWVAS